MARKIKNIEEMNEIIESYETINRCTDTKRDRQCDTSPYSRQSEFEREPADEVESFFLSKYALNDMVVKNLTFSFRNCKENKTRVVVYQNFTELFNIYGHIVATFYHESLSELSDLYDVKLADGHLKFFAEKNAIAFYSAKSGLLFALSGDYRGWTTKEEIAYIPPKQRIYEEL